MQIQTIEEGENDEKQNFVCEFCSYSTNRRNNMDKHLSSFKHVHKKENKNIFECACGKKYMHNTNLYRHRKKCTIAIEEIENKNSKIMCNLVLDVVKKQTDIVQKQTELIGTLQNQVLELTKASASSITNNINNINNTNNTKFNNCGNFNINIFLNEQCKDAINLSDFVKSLEITFENLKIVNKTSLEDSVSSLILKGLENMEVCKRPIHCTDQKRDVMYVKEEEKWEKDAGNDKLKDSIGDISRRHLYTLKNYKDANPGIKVGHELHDDFIQTMNRLCTPIENVGNKRIVKQVGKNVTMNADVANKIQS